MSPLAGSFRLRTSIAHGRYFSQTSSRNSPRRATLSEIWVPTGGVSVTDKETAHDKLLRAGFLRQSQSGIFHLLPLGLRVQEKIKKVLNKHMQSIGASRVSLSTITTEELWRKSGRLDRVSSELFRLTDRKEAELMLSPTHEEEITTLVASTLNSYKNLPLRLYQITRKYRDEIRPRQGLLRSREFLMKDLYSFDTTLENALKTYGEVAAAYRAFFAELKIPILVAEASSGDMGGDHSHEYHLANPIGEDIVVTCDSCGYTANDEVAEARETQSSERPGLANFGAWRFVTQDRKTLVNAWYLQEASQSSDVRVSPHAVKKAVPGLDTSLEQEQAIEAWKQALQSDATGETPRVINVVDSRLAPYFSQAHSELSILPEDFPATDVEQTVVDVASSGKQLNLLQPLDGDNCPRCDTGSLKLQRALELGHTFYLGTRYSKPLEANVTLPESPKTPVPIQMGCYGIGVSRIFAAVAEHLTDYRGLMWPRAIAPYEVAIIPTSEVTGETLDLYDALSSHGPGLDVILDDRKKGFGWKMRDADMTGYPVVVILGKTWRQDRMCEVQCRTLGLEDKVSADNLGQYLQDLLSRL